MLKRLNGWFPVIAGIILVIGTVWCWARYATCVEKDVEMLRLKHNGDMLLVAQRHEQGMKQVTGEIRVIKEEQKTIKSDIKEILHEVKK